LRGFFLEAIRKEKQPGLDAAQERLNAQYEPLRRGLNSMPSLPRRWPEGRIRGERFTMP